MKLLMISTDRKIFDKGSAVAQRQIEYAKKYEEVHIIVFTKKSNKLCKYCGKSCNNCGKDCGQTVNCGQYCEKAVENLFIYPTNSSSRFSYIFNALALGRFIAEKRSISHITCQDPFETGLIGVLIKNRYRVKSTGIAPELELQIHTDIGSSYFQHFNFLNRIRTLISKYTLTRANTVRVVSQRIKDYVKKYIDESKIEIRPIEVNIDKIKNAQIIPEADLHEKYPQFKKIILMISRLEKEKNIDGAIRAFKVVLNKIPDAGLIIVGNGKEKENLIELSKELKINNDNKKSIIFENWQANIDILTTYYKTCDIFLNTSWYEGYGMTLKEAEIAGCRIVSTDVGIAREVGARVVVWSEEDVAEGVVEVLK
ncbi:MAG TPA: glycosyltransferase [Candidatus Paceibacterota bacterium]